MTKVFMFLLYLPTALLAAGIKRGDLITKINGTEVTSGLEMSSVLANFKPGDKVDVTYKRKGSEYNTGVVLKKSPGNYEKVVSDNIEEEVGAEIGNSRFQKSRAIWY